MKDQAQDRLENPSSPEDGAPVDPEVLARARRAQWIIGIVGGIFMIVPILLAYLYMRNG